MESLALKLVLTPVLIGAASLAGRRWGPAVSGWPLTALASSLAFAAATAALEPLAIPAVPLFVLVVAALALALRLMPPGAAESPSAAAKASPPPRWDIPARMVMATAFVVLLTGVASALGPHLTGLPSPFPLYAAILAIFAHHLQGPAAAAGVLRGLLLGLFAFASFFLVLALLIEPTGIAPAFAAATAVALALQAGSLWVLRRRG